MAIAFAREGADVLIAYLSEHGDAEQTAKLVEDAGRRVVLVPGDLADIGHCRAVVDRAVAEFGRIDVLVNNAAYQMTHETVEEITDEEWQHTFDVNITAMFRLVKAALPHMTAGGSIINTSSINYDIPSTMPPEHVAEFGRSTPLGRPRAAKKVAPVYVLLASDEASYISGAVLPVTGGKPIL